MKKEMIREPGFDALRVFLLLLGFVLHSLLSYTQTPLNELWPYQDKSRTLVFEGIAVFIHSFRMPAFFFISGYFVEQMYCREKTILVLQKRLLRLGIPFFLGLLIMFPVINLGFSSARGMQDIFSVDALYPNVDAYGGRINTSYLWFIYYLIIFNVFHALFAIKNSFRVFEKHTFPTSLVLIFSGFILMAVLIAGNRHDLSGHYSFTPEVYSLIGYFLFYFLGILFKRNGAYMAKIPNLSVGLILTGTVGLIIYLYFLYIRAHDASGTAAFSFTIIAAYCLASISLTFSFIGFFVRFYKLDLGIVKSISNSSYFLYIIHLPVIIWMVALMSSFNWSAGVKFSLVLFSSIAVCAFINFLRIKFKFYSGV